MTLTVHSSFYCANLHRLVSGQLHVRCANTGQPTAHTPVDRQMRSQIGPPDGSGNREGIECNGYRGTGPGERARSVNERLSHHRVMSGQLYDAQKPAKRPLTHVCRPPDAFSDWITRHGVQEGTECNGYRGTGPGERVRSVNERTSGVGTASRCSNILSPAACTSVKKLRKSPRNYPIDAWHQPRLPAPRVPTRDFFRAHAFNFAPHAPGTPHICYMITRSISGIWDALGCLCRPLTLSHTLSSHLHLKCMTWRVMIIQLLGAA